ncbi:hypothetical protein BDV93DRAFT_509889 [Ceratobasidium sp. AG-I]|nr:hypothetical protein BDV93DRAFT_509889 [Ceratobasidium sp. AG-I]
MSGDSTTKTRKGYIVASTTGDIISAYTLVWSLRHPQSGIALPLTFNIATDQSLFTFGSIGAPDKKSLGFTYVPTLGKPYGLSAFSGSISQNEQGGHKVHIEIPQWKIAIDGPIEGWPKNDQGLEFTGNGIWKLNDHTAELREGAGGEDATDEPSAELHSDGIVGVEICEIPHSVPSFGPFVVPGLAASTKFHNV